MFLGFFPSSGDFAIFHFRFSISLSYINQSSSKLKDVKMAVIARMSLTSLNFLWISHGEFNPPENQTLGNRWGIRFWIQSPISTTFKYFGAHDRKASKITSETVSLNALLVRGFNLSLAMLAVGSNLTLSLIWIYWWLLIDPVSSHFSKAVVAMWIHSIKGMCKKTLKLKVKGRGKWQWKGPLMWKWRDPRVLITKGKVIRRIQLIGKCICPVFPWTLFSIVTFSIPRGLNNHLSLCI